MSRTALVEAIRASAHFLGGSHSDHDALLELARPCRYVLLGEATHGSHELYRERARITRRLIEELGFEAVVIEADWPDAERAGRWAAAGSDDADASQALGGFRRFPTWMWRNTAVAEFLDWLRAHNQRTPGPPVGFYGMDLYSLYASIEAVLAYLGRTDPAAARRAAGRYGCFDLPRGREEDGQGYGRAVRFGGAAPCAPEALAQLVELSARARATIDPELFSAEQNARLARNAEAYYRAMFGSRIASWNLRDRHMAETVEAVATFLARTGRPARVVVWAHNSHVGDARATELGDEGELNVGQLLRERYGREALLVGFTTAGGTVAAASDWGDPVQSLEVRSPLPGSLEELCHDVGLPRFLLPLRGAGPALAGLREPLLERAIGVIYRPDTERQSHYFEARVAEQFDALVHIDRTRAVVPLDSGPLAAAHEPPETYPTAL